MVYHIRYHPVVVEVYRATGLQDRKTCQTMVPGFRGLGMMPEESPSK